MIFKISFPLIIGTLIYLLFRSTDLIVFEWLESLGLIDIVLCFRQLIKIYNIELPNWVVYSLPDGLWVMSITFFMSFIWRGFNSPESIFFVLSGFLLSSGMELLQYFKYLKGTFDYVDLIICSICSMLTILYEFIYIKNLYKLFNRYKGSD